MGLFPNILYTISLEMAYFGINEIFQFDNNPLQNQEDRNQFIVYTKNQMEKHTTFH